jgi:hypothetical protein
MPQHLNKELNSIAEPYTKLVLAVGQHDADYVDAYYGPKEWSEEAKSEKKPLNAIKEAALLLKTRLDEIDITRNEDILHLRHQYLQKQIASLISRVEALNGKKLSFDEEAKAYYDVEPPFFPEEHFQKLVSELNSLVPGNGSIPERVETYRRQFTITPDKIDKVFSAAIYECRQRTKKYIDLPENETFRLEYVHNKSWSGYNWYKGNNESLIQINTDLPIFLERAIDLAAHEGYPGHHVYNCLLETAFARKFGWVEFTVHSRLLRKEQRTSASKSHSPGRSEWNSNAPCSSRSPDSIKIRQRIIPRCKRLPKNLVMPATKPHAAI